MVRGHRPRNTSASCGSYSAFVNDSGMVVIGGIGEAGGSGGGFLDHPRPPTSAAEFEPPSAVRLQRNLSLPGALREGGGNGQGFISTPPSAGLETGRGYYAAVSTPRRRRGGNQEVFDEGGVGAGGCAEEESYATEGEQFEGAGSDDAHLLASVFENMMLPCIH